MSDLVFQANLAWQGTGASGEGSAELAEGVTVTFSSPQSMGGKGSGTSPEELLIAAVSSCYSGTLFGLLRREGLAVERVEVTGIGTVTGYPLSAKFSELQVQPAIHGGDIQRKEEYERVAELARDKCFIGKTIKGNVSYQVGEVTVLEN